MPNNSENPPKLDANVATSYHNGIKVCSYNVLAQALVSRSHFPWADPTAISWKYRHILFTSQFKALNADVYCLQEVDLEQFYAYWRPMLTAEGYMTLFSHTGAQTTRKHGSLIAYRQNMFLHITHHVVDLSSLGLLSTSIPEFYQTTQANLGQIAVLLPLSDIINHNNTKNSNNITDNNNNNNDNNPIPLFIVSNHHLHWRYTLNYVKTRQATLIRLALQVITSLLPKQIVIKPSSLLQSSLSPSSPSSSSSLQSPSPIDFETLSRLCNQSSSLGYTPTSILNTFNQSVDIISSVFSSSEQCVPQTLDNITNTTNNNSIVIPSSSPSSPSSSFSDALIKVSSLYDKLILELYKQRIDDYSLELYHKYPQPEQPNKKKNPKYQQQRPQENQHNSADTTAQTNHTTNIDYIADNSTAVTSKETVSTSTPTMDQSDTSTSRPLRLSKIANQELKVYTSEIMNKYRIESSQQSEYLHPLLPWLISSSYISLVYDIEHIPFNHLSSISTTNNNIYTHRINITPNNNNNKDMDSTIMKHDTYISYSLSPILISCGDFNLTPKTTVLPWFTTLQLPSFLPCPFSHLKSRESHTHLELSRQLLQYTTSYIPESYLSSTVSHRPYNNLTSSSDQCNSQLLMSSSPVSSLAPCDENTARNPNDPVSCTVSVADIYNDLTPGSLISLKGDLRLNKSSNSPRSSHNDMPPCSTITPSANMSNNNTLPPGFPQSPSPSLPSTLYDPLFFEGMSQLKHNTMMSPYTAMISPTHTLLTLLSMLLLGSSLSSVGELYCTISSLDIKSIFQSYPLPPSLRANTIDAAPSITPKPNKNITKPPPSLCDFMIDVPQLNNLIVDHILPYISSPIYSLDILSPLIKPLQCIIPPDTYPLPYGKTPHLIPSYLISSIIQRIGYNTLDNIFNHFMNTDDIWNHCIDNLSSFLVSLFPSHMIEIDTMNDTDVTISSSSSSLSLNDTSLSLQHQISHILSTSRHFTPLRLAILISYIHYTTHKQFSTTKSDIYTLNTSDFAEDYFNNLDTATHLRTPLFASIPQVHPSVTIPRTVTIDLSSSCNSKSNTDNNNTDNGDDNTIHHTIITIPHTDILNNPQLCLKTWLCMEISIDMIEYISSWITSSSSSSSSLLSSQEHDRYTLYNDNNDINKQKPLRFIHKLVYVILISLHRLDLSFYSKDTLYHKNINNKNDIILPLTISDMLYELEQLSSSSPSPCSSSPRSSSLSSSCETSYPLGVSNPGLILPGVINNHHLISNSKSVICDQESLYITLFNNIVQHLLLLFPTIQPYHCSQYNSLNTNNNSSNTNSNNQLLHQPHSIIQYIPLSYNDMIITQSDYNNISRMLSHQGALLSGGFSLSDMPLYPPELYDDPENTHIYIESIRNTLPDDMIVSNTVSRVLNISKSHVCQIYHNAIESNLLAYNKSISCLLSSSLSSTSRNKHIQFYKDDNNNNDNNNTRLTRISAIVPPLPINVNAPSDLPSPFYSDQNIMSIYESQQDGTQSQLLWPHIAAYRLYCIVMTSLPSQIPLFPSSLSPAPAPRPYLDAYHQYPFLPSLYDDNNTMNNNDNTILSHVEIPSLLSNQSIDHDNDINSSSTSSTPTNLKYSQQSLSYLTYINLKDGSVPLTSCSICHKFINRMLSSEQQQNLLPLPPTECTCTSLFSGPAFTNHSPGFAGSLDHILVGTPLPYSSNSTKTTVMPQVTALRVLETAQIFQQGDSLPTTTHPSDHLPLLCVISPINKSIPL